MLDFGFLKTVRPRHFLGQALIYLGTAAFIAWLSAHPTYTRLAPDQGVLKLSLTHAGQRAEPCHERTPEELAKLPPNMRAKMSCSRARLPVTLEMDLNGKTIFRETAAPAGLSKDGNSRFYHRYVLPAGAHRLAVRLRDGRGPAFDYTAERDVIVQPGKIMVIDFINDKGQFIFLGV
ncbi:MAG: hypothetical protein HZC25_07840 [Rhodospirillales bacterium]|nr:hypothetical protein [Rhodospirillales bacterium]